MLHQNYISVKCLQYDRSTWNSRWLRGHCYLHIAHEPARKGNRMEAQGSLRSRPVETSRWLCPEKCWEGDIVLTVASVVRSWPENSEHLGSVWHTWNLFSKFYTVHVFSNDVDAKWRLTGSGGLEFPRAPWLEGQAQKSSSPSHQDGCQYVQVVPWNLSHFSSQCPDICGYR